MLGDPDPAPLLARELGGDPPGAEAWMPERERDHALLEVRADLVGHPRAPALPDPERLQPPAVDLALQAMVGRVVHSHRPARRAHPDLLGQREQPQAIAEQHVIMRHAAHSSLCLAMKTRE